VHDEDSVQKILAARNRSHKANGWSCSSQLWYCSAVTVYPIIQDYGEEWRQNTTLLKSKQYVHYERLWFNSTDADTNFWAGIQWLDVQ